jgi:low molecular weight protein-tyrosine phosphatase
MGTGEYVVAFVCTGNRFRSPLAAAAFATQAEVPIQTVSAGLLKLGPVRALPEAVELAQSFGLDLTSHRARDLSGVDLEPFDLVLGFERSHVQAAVVDASARIERTFTLPELVHLLEGVPERVVHATPVAQARERVAEAHAARLPGFRTVRMPEVVDPLGRSRHEQRAIAEEVCRLTGRLARLLFG